MSAPRRVEELLAERATQGLDAAEARELQRLIDADSEIDADGFDLAAAALHLSMTRRIEAMPEAVRRSALARVRAEMAAGRDRSLAPVTDLAAERTRRRPSPAAETRRPARALPWLAAAAALVLAIAGWWPRLGAGPGTESAAGAGPEPGSAATTSLAAVAAAPDAVRWAWAGTGDPAAGEVGGEVVWSSSEQRGYMRIRGLAVNDPAVEQYQLWIFDRAQDERFPVDGGVFDVAADELRQGGEVVIPIDAKIAVDEPYLFAVTVEKPGGVVVSSRERIAILAQA